MLAPNVALASAVAVALLCVAGVIPISARATNDGKHRWTAGARAPASAPVRITLALQHDSGSGRAELERLFWDVSDPDSPNRGKYVEHAHASRLLRPPQASIDEVTSWLAAVGVDEKQIHVTPWGDHVIANATVAVAEAALGVHVHEFSHPKNPHAMMTAYGEDDRAIPAPADARVAEHVVYASVVGLVTQAHMHRLRGDTNTLRRRAQGASSDDADSGTPYPFEFFPPNIVSEALAYNGAITLEIMLVCPDDPWPQQHLPLGQDVTLPYPGTDEYAPCAGNSDEKAKISAIEVLLTPSNGDKPKTATVPFANAQCEKTTYQVPQGSSANLAWSVGTCEVQFVGTLAADVKHTVDVTFHFADGSTQSQRWQSFPDLQPLALVEIQEQLPSDIKTRYNVPTNAGACDASTQQGIIVLQEDTSGFYSESDLQYFYTSAGYSQYEAQSVRFESTIPDSPELDAFMDANGLDGPFTLTNDQTNPGGETSLDVQWSSAMARGALTSVWHGGYFALKPLHHGQPDAAINPLVGVFIALQYVADPPQAVSISYGGSETTPRLTQFLNDIFIALGSAGMTIIVSSGDTGAYEPLGTVDYSCSQFMPSWPATSPYVTAVGGTQLVYDEASGSSIEVPASILTGASVTSGGGFSAANHRAHYQDDAVQHYFNTVPAASMPPVGSFNVSGRGYPDVSLFGHSFEVVVGSLSQPVDGTSASAPTFMGIVTLWNDALTRSGGSSLGFLNPTLYKMKAARPASFRDINGGTNNCLGQVARGVCCTYGYPASSGWDPISGLGVVDFQEAWAYIAETVLKSTTASTYPVGSCNLAHLACTRTCSDVSTCKDNGVCGATETFDWLFVAAMAAAVFMGTFCICMLCAVRRQNRALAAKRGERERDDEYLYEQFGGVADGDGDEGVRGYEASVGQYASIND